MRVLALTIGDASQASSYYRIYQYAEPLRERGIQLEIRPVRDFEGWSTLRRYDGIIVQKKLLSLGKVRRLRRRTKCLIYDVDDAIWHPHGKRHFWLTTLRVHLRLKAIAQAADVCFVANDVLARFVKRWNQRVVILPMALAERDWSPKPPLASRDSPIRIGWAGHPVNLIYLEGIESALLAVQRQFPQVEFVVFCGQNPGFKNLKFKLIPYRSEAQPEVIRSFDIGMLPLPGGDFAEGKSPIKGVQYMACGIPSVVSPLGASREMFQDGQTALFAGNEAEWIRSLELLVRNFDLRRQIGEQARQQFERRYCLSKTAPLLAAELLSSAQKDHTLAPQTLGCAC